MTHPVLTTAQLNRATLARQMLLARETVSPREAIERLAGMQAQLPRPPVIGLWSRLEGFRREDLAELTRRREVVRATLMRGTLHFASAKDYSAIRPALQPMLSAAMRAVLRERAEALDVDGLVAAARAYLAKGPRTFEEIRDHLTALGLPGDERARGFAVRTHLPLIQVPDASAWGYPSNAPFALAEAWLGERFRPDENVASGLRALVLSYLAAFGPASVADAQSWSGVSPLQSTFEELRNKLTVFKSEKGKELFDLPGAPRPPEDTAAPVRFLPEYDNLVMGHDDRSRVIAKEHRSLVYQPGLRILATFLVDGVVAGTWEIERIKGISTLLMKPFADVPKQAKDALCEEAEKLTRFIDPEAKGHDVRFASDKPSAPAEPSASKKAAAPDKPSASKKAAAPAKPSASKKASAAAKPSASKKAAAPAKPSAADKPTASKKASARAKPPMAK